VVPHTFIALLRGINVGKANRIPMADLRALLEGLGHTDVTTLLNSGNAVFRATKGTSAKHATDIAADATPGASCRQVRARAGCHCN
jgi:uncharacterized protein (DUF1697 family)